MREQRGRHEDQLEIYRSHQGERHQSQYQESSSINMVWISAILLKIRCIQSKRNTDLVSFFGVGGFFCFVFLEQPWGQGAMGP